MPPNDSKFWPMLKLAVMGCVLALLLHVNYRHGFTVNADLPTLFEMLLVAAGLQALPGGTAK